MTTRGIGETSPLIRARIGGLLYLLIILGGLFAPFAIAPTGMMLGEASVPSPAQIMASRSLYALGGATQLMVYACDVGVALVFFELLKPVNRSMALLGALFRLVFVAVASANIIIHFAPLVLLSGADSLNAVPPGESQALALAFIRLRTFGFDIALVFFGFHCLIVGYLLFRSTFLPRVLGLGLAAGGLGYLANIFATIIPPAMKSHIFPYIMWPAGIAEIALTLWLIIRGVNVTKWKEQAPTVVRP